MVGKVKSPGTYTPGRYINALEASSIAGGGTEFASLNNSLIRRKVGQQLQTIRVRLGDALRGDRADLIRHSVHPERGYIGGALMNSIRKQCLAATAGAVAVWSAPALAQDTAPRPTAPSGSGISNAARERGLHRPYRQPRVLDQPFP